MIKPDLKHYYNSLIKIESDLEHIIVERNFHPATILKVFVSSFELVKYIKEHEFLDEYIKKSSWNFQNKVEWQTLRVADRLRYFNDEDIIEQSAAPAGTLNVNDPSR